MNRQVSIPAALRYGLQTCISNIAIFLPLFIIGLATAFISKWTTDWVMQDTPDFYTAHIWTQLFFYVFNPINFCVFLVMKFVSGIIALDLYDNENISFKRILELMKRHANLLAFITPVALPMVLIWSRHLRGFEKSLTMLSQVLHIVTLILIPLYLIDIAFYAFIIVERTNQKFSFALLKESVQAIRPIFWSLLLWYIILSPIGFVLLPIGFTFLPVMEMALAHIYRQLYPKGAAQ